ncbi:lymphocyte antigen 96 isoform X2 [Lissotriton helveticus]
MATLGPLILLTLFILAFCREPEKHTLCISPYLTMEYVYCGKASYAPKIVVHSCDSRPNGVWNIHIFWIPSFDVKNFYVILDIWYESMKILERTLDACTGHDDEMEFCGNLKGETIWINFHKALPIRLLNKIWQTCTGGMPQ